MNRKNRILVVGANGFLGYHLCENLISDNFEVYALINKSKERIEQLQVYKFIFWEDLLENKIEFEVIIDCAAFIPKDSTIDYQRLISSNSMIPLIIAKYQQKAHYIFASTVSIYGQGHCNKIKLNSSSKNIGAYGLSKYLGEKVVIDLFPKHSIIRFSSIYGKYMAKNTFLPRIIKSAKEKGEVTLFNCGHRRQNYLHVKDAVDYMVTSIKNEVEGIYLGVCPKEYSNLEIAKLLDEYLNFKLNFDENEDEGLSYIYDGSKSFAAFNKNEFVLLENCIGTLIHELK